MTIRRALLFLLLAILIGAAVNLPFATLFLKSRTDSKGVMIKNINGPEAALMDWPTTTPHQQAWPPPTQWSESRAFAYQNIGIWSSTRNRQSVHQMIYELIGWPFPVYEHVQIWWPRKDPNWQSTAQSDPAMRLYWQGVLLNPLIIGGGLWLVFIFPIFTWVQVRTHIRHKHGRCLKCGYDLRGDLESGCSECGWNREVEQRV